MRRRKQQQVGAKRDVRVGVADEPGEHRGREAGIARLRERRETDEERAREKKHPRARERVVELGDEGPEQQRAGEEDERAAHVGERGAGTIADCGMRIAAC
jgi:hypothetical protein